MRTEKPWFGWNIARSYAPRTWLVDLSGMNLPQGATLDRILMRTTSTFEVQGVKLKERARDSTMKETKLSVFDSKCISVLSRL
jgi:hypothetical protein